MIDSLLPTTLPQGVPHSSSSSLWRVLWSQGSAAMGAPWLRPLTVSSFLLRATHKNCTGRGTASGRACDGSHLRGAPALARD